MQKLDLTGQTFGYLTVIKEADSTGYWNCLCKCGEHTTVKGASLRNGNTKSCGCLRKSSIRVSVPGKFRKPQELIDRETYINTNAPLILQFAASVKPYGIKFDLTNMMYITRHDGKAYGPFDSPVHMIGHVLMHAVGEPSPRTIRSLEAWRSNKLTSK